MEHTSVSQVIQEDLEQEWIEILIDLPLFNELNYLAMICPVKK